MSASASYCGHDVAQTFAALCRFCCKSLFPLVIKNSPGFGRDFRVKMWGTSSPEDKLADDLGNTIEGTRISGRRLDFFTAGKLALGNLRLLQQYLPIAAVCRCSAVCAQLISG